MTKSGYITLAILFFILLIGFLYYLNVQRGNENEILQRSPAANSLNVEGDASYTELQGNPASLNQYVGTSLVTFAWASWCPVCGDQLKILADVAGDYESVKVLAFNRAEPINTARSYLSLYGLENTVELIMDPTDHFFNSVEGYSMPETIIFNTVGEVVHHERGEISDEKLRFLLNKFAADTSQN